MILKYYFQTINTQHKFYFYNSVIEKKLKSPMIKPKPKNPNFIPRSIKSSGNLRLTVPSTSARINQIITTGNFHSKHERSIHMKFRPIEQQRQITFKKISFQSEKNGQFPNQLDSMYNIYANGSPNYYSQNFQFHKANNIKNDVQTLDLPFIDNVINELKGKSSSQKENTANMRDCEMYPNLINLHQTHKFKDLLSDKQELRDFLKWFETSLKMIQTKNISQYKKFQEKQILMSAGFGQMTQQVAKLSRLRAQILKMIWNKQNGQVEQIIQNLIAKNIELQKQHLTTMSTVHQKYQKQIDFYKEQNSTLKKRLFEQDFVNNGYVNSMRCSRKTIKKYEILIKKLISANENLVNENLVLLDQNTKLILNGHLVNQSSNSAFNQQSSNISTIKNSIYQQIRVPNYPQAKILLYRRLQIAQTKASSKKDINQIKRTLFAKIKKQSEIQVQKKPFYMSSQQLQQQKSALHAYVLQRFENNPQQKIFMKQDLFHEQDHNLGNQGVEDIMKSLIHCKDIQLYLKKQHLNVDYQVKQIGVNTPKNGIQSNRYLQNVSPQKSDIESEFLSQNKFQQLAIKSNQKKQLSFLEGCLQTSWQEGCQKKIRQSKLNTRNSLLNLELQKLKEFVGTKIESNFKQQFYSSQEQNCLQQLSQEGEITQSQRDSNFKESSNNAKPYNNGIKQSRKVSNPKAIRMLKLQKSMKSFSKLKINYEELHSRLGQNINESLNVTSKVLRNPENILGATITQVWTNIIEKFNTLEPKDFKQLFLKQLYSGLFAEKIDNVLGSSSFSAKSMEKKLLKTVQTLKYFQSANETCLISCLLLNVSQKFKRYEGLIKDDIGQLYFDLFQVLINYQVLYTQDSQQKSHSTIKSEGRVLKIFDVWNPTTTLKKLRGQQKQQVLQKYFSKIQILQINQKIEQLIKYSRTKNQQNISQLKIQTSDIQKPAVKLNNSILVHHPSFLINQTTSTMPLNSLLLYVIEVYLIEKQKYHTSYRNFMNFFVQNELGSGRAILTQKWKILAKIFNLHQQSCFHHDNASIHCEDYFYRQGVKYELPLLQQKLIQTQMLIKKLPDQIIQKLQINVSEDISVKPMQQLNRWSAICILIQQKFKEQSYQQDELKGLKRIMNKMKLAITKRQDLENFFNLYKLIIWRYYASVQDENKEISQIQKGSKKHQNWQNQGDKNINQEQLQKQQSHLN